MNKEDLLLRIADTAYNVGYGAKKNFATYDIVEKAPGWIGFISFCVGIFALYIDVLGTKHISAVLIVLGISSLYITTYNEMKQDYEKKGVLLIGLFNELKSLYYQVKSSKKEDFPEETRKLSEIEKECLAYCITRQIFFSDLYAHYKFFWQHQIDWITEQKQFRFWRDKVPLSFIVSCILAVLAILTISFYCLCLYSKGVL